MRSVAPKAAATGDDATANARTSLRAERPMLVYVTADDADSSETRKLEDVVFANENFAIGTKFFHCVKVTEGNAMQDRILSEAGKGAPRIILLTRDYKEHKTYDGRGMSAGKILKGMSALARKEYVNKFDKMVKGYVKLLNELDRLEGKKAQIADQRARLNDKPSASKEKKLAREEKAFQKDMENWQERESKLLELRVKGAKPADAEA